MRGIIVTIMNLTENTKLREIKSVYPSFIEVRARQYPVLEKLDGCRSSS